MLGHFYSMVTLFCFCSFFAISPQGSFHISIYLFIFSYYPDGRLFPGKTTVRARDPLVDVVAQDGAAALYGRLLPGDHHVVLVGVMTTHVQRGHGRALRLHISICHRDVCKCTHTHTHTHSSVCTKKSKAFALKQACTHTHILT